jgi:hypothetical protein
MIQDLCYISGLKPDLAKSSYRESPLFLHLPMDNHHFGCTKKSPKKKLAAITPH